MGIELKYKNIFSSRFACVLYIIRFFKNYKKKNCKKVNISNQAYLTV